MHVLEKILFLIVAVTIASGALAAGNPGGGSQGKGNANAQSLPDADRGLDRAQERKSEQGLAHGQAATKKKTNKAKANESGLDPAEPPKPRVP